MKKKKTDTGTGQARSQHTWEYMSQLTFLTQVSSQRNTLTNEEEASITSPADLNTENESQTQDDINQDVILETQGSVEDSHKTDSQGNDQLLSPEQSSTPSRKKNKTSHEHSLVTILEKRQQQREQLLDKLLTQTETVPEKSAIHKFFESMADTVSNFPPHLVAETRLQVCKIVTDMELKMHNEQWRITTPASLPSTSSGTPMPSSDSCDSWILTQI